MEVRDKLEGLEESKSYIPITVNSASVIIGIRALYISFYLNIYKKYKLLYKN